MALETEQEGITVDGTMCNQHPANVGLFYFIMRIPLLSNRMHGFRIIRHTKPVTCLKNLFLAGIKSEAEKG
jgi:hypothetical protein